MKKSPNRTAHAQEDNSAFYDGIRLEPTDCPPEPKVAYQTQIPHKTDDLTLIDGRTFLASTISGNIAPPGAPDVGFFSSDTRFLSHLELKVGGQATILLSSSTERTYASQIEMTMKTISAESTVDIPQNTIHMRREQVLAHHTLFDSLQFENFSDRDERLKIEMILDADFMDIFQVRGLKRGCCGQYYKPISKPDAMIFVYHGRDRVERTTTIHFAPPPASITNRTALWNLTLQPNTRVEVLLSITPHSRDMTSGNERKHAPAHKNGAKKGTPAIAHSGYSTLLQQRREAFSKWQKDSTSFQSSNQGFDLLLAHSIGDMHALQIPEANSHIIAAGIPWFDTIFGRDSLIAAYQVLMLNPHLATGTLRVLAHYQGTAVDDERDEEPGKILHEYRAGEMSRQREVPFGHYYGSVDSTPFFLILFATVLDWIDDEQLYRDLLPAAQAALQWIDEFGDLDGDGLIEYQRRSPKGLANQGWKDSGDSSAFPDGTLAKAPIALIEVQGYVYEAKCRMAALLDRHGEHTQARKLRQDAESLRERIDQAFWMPDKRYYAMALDKDKRQLQVISSNPGHLLFTGAVSQARAENIAQCCLRDGLNSGWGIRTLSQKESTFNPLSYHRGSVWPHDNSLIVHGLAQRGFRKRAGQICADLFDAALHFRDYRLPELFCGIQRRPYEGPVEYPVSCSPQAWASGSMLLMLWSMLGLRPSAHKHELLVNDPALPTFLDWLQIRNLRVGNSRVCLDFSRRDGRTFCNVVDVQGDSLRVSVNFDSKIGPPGVA
ncbi:MAG TPA: glycogen debranching N-terminal domain-containing protein [Acidobacteriaceae bacterium]|nr:glycogen debranching N-terminal domain-containing protein [Acidobacteriaceae bacterium]